VRDDLRSLHRDLMKLICFGVGSDMVVVLL